MIKNYLRSALRNISRHKFISFINISGLTIGLTCCLLILIYIINEVSYDRFNTNAKDIYRVTRSFNSADGVVNLNLGAVAPPFGPLLKNEFSDIKKITRVYPNNGVVTLRYKDKLFNETGACFADENFFDFFTLKIIKGDTRTALNEPYSVMLTEELARKYFGDEDPINKEIRFEDQFNFKVTGVYKKFPATSHLHPEMLMSFNTLNNAEVYGKKRLETNWENNAFYTYLLFPSNYNIAQVKSRLPAFLDKYLRQEGDAGSTKPSAWN